jgi:lysozyme
MMRPITRKIGAAGLDIIKFSEALRLEAYLPTPHDVWTIGYGHTRGVREGDTCTPQQAESYLREDCFDAEREVDRAVLWPINQNQFDALVSLVFNIGGTNFRNSTLLRRLNEGLVLDAAQQFAKWNKQNGEVLGGLVIRRQKERELFESL